MTVGIRVGDCRELLKAMPAESVQCVVTSPPYWGLRSYTGGEGMIGLEPTFEEHLEHLVEVFREVRRVLRVDGTCWLNYGDAYWSGGHNNFGWKAKDFMDMPGLVSTSLMRDGWYRRSPIIWHKPNPMPESVTDRPTSAHEKLYLLTKAARYFYDAEAVRVPVTGGAHRFKSTSSNQRGDAKPRLQGKTFEEEQANGANLHNVWSITTHSYSEAHFATFPPKLVEPCILAGTSAKGCCAECGAPLVRVVDKELVGMERNAARVKTGADPNSAGDNRAKDGHRRSGSYAVTTTGWQPTCGCGADTKPCVVLDPFSGAGTVGLVADRLNRDAILLELSPKYAEMARERIVSDAPLLAEVHLEG